MFVRWKKRMSTIHWQKDTHYTLSAYIVESKRIDGKPRQKVIAFLGSIKSVALQPHLAFIRVSFYRRIKEKFDELGIKEQDIQKFTRELAEKVPFPTAEEMQDHKRQMAELHTKYPSLNEM